MKTLPLALLASALSIPGALSAQSIVVDNPGFENADLDDDTRFTTDTADDWLNLGNTLATAVQWTGSPGLDYLGSGYGNSVLILDQRYTGGHFQDVGTIVDNSIYEFSVTIGGRSNQSLNADYEIGLWEDTDTGDGVTLSSLSTLDEVGVGLDSNSDIKTITISWDSTGSSAVGKDLYLAFRTGYTDTSGTDVRQVFVDNVSLSVVPEPAAYGLLVGFVGLAAGLARRRR